MAILSRTKCFKFGMLFQQWRRTISHLVTYKIASSIVKHVNFDAGRWSPVKNRTRDTATADFINKSSRRFVVGHADGLHMLSHNHKSCTH